MHLKDVLSKCKELDYPITASALYVAGLKNGFLIRKEKGKSLEFNKEKFFEWLNKAKAKIPEGWVTVNQLHSILNISLSQAYILIKLPESNAKKIGAGKGVFYVDPERIKAIIKERENQHKEQW
ncbi:MAG: hypothetical protein GX220_05145 [Treponema sp.]|nr:hypothetical protein [Treponema sp.]